MKKFVYLTLCVLLTACASNIDEKTTVTGQRISKEEAKKLNLKPVGTFQDLIDSHFEGMPEIGSFKNCEELLKQLEEQSIKIQSIKEREVVAVSDKNKLLTYTFNDGTCLR